MYLVVLVFVTLITIHIWLYPLVLSTLTNNIYEYLLFVHYVLVLFPFIHFGKSTVVIYAIGALGGRKWRRQDLPGVGRAANTPPSPLWKEQRLVKGTHSLIPLISFLLM